MRPNRLLLALILIVWLVLALAPVALVVGSGDGPETALPVLENFMEKYFP